MGKTSKAIGSHEKRTPRVVATVSEEDNTELEVALRGLVTELVCEETLVLQAVADLRQVRGRLGLSTTEAARLLHVSNSTVKSWERGDSLPGLRWRRNKVVSFVQKAKKLIEELEAKK